MATVTADTLVNDAARILGALGIGQTLDSDNAETARTFLNDLLSEWGTTRAFIPFTARLIFPLVANQGGPLTPYTIGVGGDFNTPRPPSQSSIVSANLILTATTPNVRVPLGLYTDEAYDANQIPDLSNTQPTALYYNPTYAGQLGSISLWPVPTINTNTLELFLLQPIAQFADLATVYDVPDGLPRALKYNLAMSLESVFQQALPPSVAPIAVSALARFKRTNHHLSDLANDADFGTSNRTLYNINSGSGGG